MKKKIDVPTVAITYPFSDQDPPAYLCRCGKTLRRSNMHNRIYEVSKLDNNEIRTQRKHICATPLAKNTMLFALEKDRWFDERYETILHSRGHTHYSVNVSFPGEDSHITGCWKCLTHI